MSKSILFMLFLFNLSYTYTQYNEIKIFNVKESIDNFKEHPNVKEILQDDKIKKELEVLKHQPDKAIGFLKDRAGIFSTLADIINEIIYLHKIKSLGLMNDYISLLNCQASNLDPGILRNIQNAFEIRYQKKQEQLMFSTEKEYQLSCLLIKEILDLVLQNASQTHKMA